MPVENDEFARVWKFVDKFQPGEKVRRGDLDTAMDDLVAGINAALQVNSEKIAEEAAQDYLDAVTDARDQATAAASEAEASASAAQGSADDAKGSADDAAASESSVQRNLTDAETAAQTAVSEAAKADAARNLAEAAADAAAIGAQGVYRTISAGLAATADTETFIVATADGWILYTNAAGVEDNPSGTFPSLTKLRSEIEEDNRTLAVSQPRPAELLSRYTSAKTGDRTGAAITATVVEDGDGYGQCIDVGPAVVIALRDRIWINDSGEVVRAQFSVAQNTTDPEGEPIYFGVAWLNADYTANGVTAETLFYEAVTWQTDGWITVTETINGLGTQPPAGAVYAVPFIQTSGTAGTTRIALLEGNAAQLAAPNLVYPAGFEFPGSAIPAHVEENILHVATNGNDTLDGSSRRGAVLTIERAIEIAGNNPGDKFAISVHPGGYTTEGNLDVPDNVSAVFGNHNARSTRIMPAGGFEERSAFRLGDGGYVEGFSFQGGWRTDSLTNPTVGVISFRPNAVIARAVYVHNVTFYRPQPATLLPPPLDRENGNPAVGNGPCCILADKSIISQYSPFPQIMMWGATPVSPNNVGYVAKKGAFINGINAVGLWSHRGFMALDGGEMILTNCASQFGDYSLVASGSRQQAQALSTAAALGVYQTAADAITSNRQSIIDAMWADLLSGGYTGDETLTRRDAGFFLDALTFDLESGQQEGAQIFAEGMFDWNAQFVGTSLEKPDFVRAWEFMRDEINGLGIAVDAQTMVTGLVDDVIVATVQADPTPSRTRISRVTSLFHQWNNTGTGVNGRALRRAALSVPDTIIEENLGRVSWNGQDDQRRLYLNQQFVINGLTGQAEGAAVDRTINPRARLAALVIGGQS